MNDEEQELRWPYPNSSCCWWGGGEIPLVRLGGWLCGWSSCSLELNTNLHTNSTSFSLKKCVIPGGLTSFHWEDIEMSGRGLGSLEFQNAAPSLSFGRLPCYLDVRIMLISYFASFFSSSFPPFTQKDPNLLSLNINIQSSQEYPLFPYFWSFAFP